jgi:hypothetical protein
MPWPPDSIERAFSKLKALLRKAAERQNALLPRRPSRRQRTAC